ncbi:NAD-dependent epimerase/dehydratase family protein [Priestia megaterium]|uniref:NAD-dependent epimerase/dehydratase family protein n=1 Tax=Priestia megaterium TaxID=1404 RepID=UPI002079BD5D|nr:NAD-dependent epimerase/dehydratase family protein [Priestia megaterium]USL25722.1 NAD-dependent epimerase/dehydratase family protein [Priestia megaterium]
MKVIVTGGAGFIGSFTIQKLLKLNYEVTILDNLSTGNKDTISPAVRFVQGDINDLDLHIKLKDSQFDAIIHLAAQTSVPMSIENPEFDALQNIQGTINILNVARKIGIKKIVFSSSAAVYGDQIDLPIQERYYTEPTSPYGISKLAGEQYIKTFCEANNISYSILRYANVYGPKQSDLGEGGVVKIFIDYLMKNKKLVVFGDGTQTRDFVYVKDIAAANVKALNAPSDIYNVSSGREVSINELILNIEKAIGKKLELSYEKARSGDIYRSCLDNKRISDSLSWSINYSIEEGIRETINSVYQFN